MNNETLLIIGNGFDLHLKLKSGFTDFFENDICKINDDIIFTIYLSENTPTPKNTFIGGLNLFRDYTNFKNFESNDYKLKQLCNSIIDNVDNNISVNMYFLDYKSDINYNFWNIYFKFLEDASDKGVIGERRFTNWNDIESQINSFLDISSDFFDFYVKYYKLMRSRDRNLQSHYDQYASENKKYFLDENGKINDTGLIRLVSIYILLYVGWKPDKQKVYDFLFKELKRFEEQFRKYLSGTIQKFSLYNEKANKLANKISDNKSFNLINFNYTSFYPKDDITKNNIHSTLDSNPIFGIGDIRENERITPYYMFTKTYRIMSLASKDNVNETLHKDISKIIFYGHSLSDADYDYFESIFDYYDIYNSKLKVVFKFSCFSDNPENDEKQQIDNIYKLIIKYGRSKGHKNILNKLLIENRLKLEEVID